MKTYYLKFTQYIESMRLILHNDLWGFPIFSNNAWYDFLFFINFGFIYTFHVQYKLFCFCISLVPNFTCFLPNVLNCVAVFWTTRFQQKQHKLHNINQNLLKYLSRSQKTTDLGPRWQISRFKALMDYSDSRAKVPIPLVTDTWA